MTRPSDKLFLRALAGETLPVPPLWMMRQAGRYLPEYRALRAEARSFLDLCYNPKLATEVTLQPIRRFGFDASILFADILVVPHALGQALWFAEGEGPRLSPVDSWETFNALLADADAARVGPVLETVSRVRAALPHETALIGFCGAPWTVATYMIAGRGTPDQGPAKRLMQDNEPLFAAMITRLVDVSTEYLAAQIEAGAEVVQIFDSWAGSLTGEAFDRWCIAPVAEMVSRLRSRYPQVPVIGFPRGAGRLIPRYLDSVPVQAVSLETEIDRDFAAREIQSRVAVQGHLDPLVLRAGGPELEQEVAAIRSAFGQGPFVFNLGHGILPDTPIAHVERLIAAVRQ